MFPFFLACQANQTHFLVRAAQNRRTEADEEEITYSLDRARAFPSQQSRPLEVPARHGHKARSTQVQLAFGHMTLLPPRHEPQASNEPLTVWVIRVWEELAPEGEKPLEWILLTSVPTMTLEQARERVDWYRQRWLVEIVQSQMTKTKLFRTWGSGDHIADLHFLVGDYHTVN
ncbi:transposase [Ktedonobacter sp. SOSP1-52]|uniref:transposase n=1 Tax=Ktedonobacter sp. SOSP1-52 TaxID=2778366 RepID=UPI0035AEDE19